MKIWLSALTASTCLALLAGVLSLALVESAEGVEIMFRTLAPRIDRISTTIPLPDGDVVELRPGYNEKGQLVSRGISTVDGFETTLKGKARPVAGGLSFKISLKSTADPAGTIAVKISGSLGGTSATCSYKGPKGKVSNVECVLVIEADSELYARMEIDATLDCRGKISGQGKFLTAFGNDSGVFGPVKGKLNTKKGKFKLTVKSGKQKLTYKGQLLAGSNVITGSAKVKLLPEKNVFDLQLDSRIFARPPECAEGGVPVARAGDDQKVNVGDTVFLDGSASSDPDGDPLSYTWTFVSIPEGSTAMLLSPFSQFTDFFVDLPGVYEAELIVNDGNSDSAPDRVIISTNFPPVADAGADQDVLVGTTVTLNGTASSDPDQDPLQYEWFFNTRPLGSNSVLSDSTSATPSFVADATGQYEVALNVFDGQLFSQLQDTVVVNADFPNAPGWGLATQVSMAPAGGAGFGRPQISVDAAGDAMAVWTQGNAQTTDVDVVASRYEFGSGWGTPVSMETDPTGFSDQVRVACDPSGNAIAVWYRRGDPSGGDHIWGNRYDTTAGWGSAEIIDILPPELSIGVGVVSGIAMSPGGVGFAVWWELSDEKAPSGNPYSNVMARRHLPGTGWEDEPTIVNTGIPRVIGVDLGHISVANSHVAVDDNGNAMVVWSQSDLPGGVIDTVYANRYDASGSAWTGAEPVYSAGASNAAFSARLTVNAVGEAFVSWFSRESSQTTFDGWSKRYDLTNGWDDTAAPMDFLSQDFEHQTAMDAAGNVFAVWTDQFVFPSRVFASRLDASTGEWSQAERLSGTAALSAFGPQIGADASGNAIAVWEESDMQTQRIWTRRYEPGSGWSAAGVCDAPFRNALFDMDPALAVNRSGIAFAIWNRNAATGASISANRFEP